MDNKLLQLEKELKDLYLQSSKHSQYQKLPSDFEGILDERELGIVSRYEKERWEYIRSNLEMGGKKVIDIGGNSGFFSFEAIHAGAKQVDYFEGNKAHAEFVKKAAKLLKRNINVYNVYYDFNTGEGDYDVAFLLNVLHHVGDDYGKKELVLEQAKSIILQQINDFAKVTDILVFQMGFNWKGDRNSCLFQNGTKQEMIEYIEKGTAHYWNIIDIGIAQQEQGKTKYVDLSLQNIERDDRLGEFLNRPIFIMKSKRIYC